MLGPRPIIVIAKEIYLTQNINCLIIIRIIIYIFLISSLIAESSALF